MKFVPAHIRDWKIGAPDTAITLIAGPCVIESRDLCFEVADAVCKIAKQHRIHTIFKASFDKANRSSADSFRGHGMDKGLEVLAEISSKYSIPVTTDIHESWQAKPVAEVVELLQIPAFLCRQTDLLVAAAQTGRAVNVKKGQFMAPWDMKNVVDKLEQFGCQNILLTERGASFGYNSLVVDFTSLPIMRSLGRPIVFDATHSVQQPGGLGSATGGRREFIPHLARAAVAVGIDALFMEVHPKPDQGKSDPATMFPLDRLDSLITGLIELHQVARRIEILGSSA